MITIWYFFQTAENKEKKFYHRNSAYCVTPPNGKKKKKKKKPKRNWKIFIPKNYSLMSSFEAPAQHETKMNWLVC